jgi:drug/metabolite transporter (DMT)-like permease
LSSIALRTPITVVTSLIYTQPIFTAVISQIMGKEKVTQPKSA